MHASTLSRASMPYVSGLSAASFLKLMPVLTTQFATISEPLGDQTNNFAEYTGLLRGLQAALACGVRHIRIKGDSKLVVMQVNSSIICSCLSTCSPTQTGVSSRGLSRVGQYLLAGEWSVAGAQCWPEAPLRTGHGFAEAIPELHH